MDWNDPVQTKAYQAAYYKANKSLWQSRYICRDKAAKNAQQKLYYTANKEKVKAYVKQWRNENPGKYTVYARKSKYGLTEHQQKELLAGLCALCGKRKAMVIDHDHKTGRVRGGLCVGCNLGLGLFKDDRELLRKAVEYLGL